MLFPRVCLNLVICLTLSSLARAGAKASLPSFLFGTCDSNPAALPYLEELDIHWARVDIPWKMVTPEVQNPELTLAEVQAHPELVDALIRETDWSWVDGRMRELLDRGVQPIPVIGHGYRSQHALIHGELATPDRLGREQYLGQMYLYSRAVVERYDGDGYLDAEGIVIKFWQMENELNQAGLTAAWGWREPTWLQGLRSAWNDWEFLTRLLTTLHQAVHDADPEAVTYMNFHTDIPPRISRLLRQPSWLEAVRQWQDLMEVIGFDAYPNYYTAEPVRGAVIGERVRMIQSAAPGKPVFIAEVDYPTGPAVRGFSEERQAEFIRESFQAAREAGAMGYLKFSVLRDDRTPTAITEKDLRALERVVPWWEEGRALRLLLWGIPQARYINAHFLDVVKTVEGYWGVVTPEGRKKPGFAVLQEIAGENASASAP